MFVRGYLVTGEAGVHFLEGQQTYCKARRRGQGRGCRAEPGQPTGVLLQLQWLQGSAQLAPV